MNEPVELYIILGGFVVVSLVIIIGWIDAWWRTRKGRQNVWRIKRRLFRDLPMASRRDK